MCRWQTLVDPNFLSPKCRYEWEFEHSELTRDQIRKYMLAETEKVAAILAKAKMPQGA